MFLSRSLSVCICPFCLCVFVLFKDTSVRWRKHQIDYVTMENRIQCFSIVGFICLSCCFLDGLSLFLSLPLSLAVSLSERNHDKCGNQDILCTLRQINKKFLWYLYYKKKFIIGFSYNRTRSIICSIYFASITNVENNIINCKKIITIRFFTWCTRGKKEKCIQFCLFCPFWRRGLAIYLNTGAKGGLHIPLQT